MILKDKEIETYQSYVVNDAVVVPGKARKTIKHFIGV
jgi:hypothetical protein